MLDYVLFVIGFLFLIKGADILVDGSVSIAKKLKISSLVIGLTVVSLGTSAPELFVNIMSSISGNAEIGIGNIFGSNISNILLILGISAIIYPLPVKRNTILSEIPFSLTATMLVGFLANAALFWEVSLDSIYVHRSLFIDRWEGVLLLMFFILFMAYIIKITKEKADEHKINQIMGREDKDEDDKEENDGYKELSSLKSILFIILGIVGLLVGGDWVVTGAIKIAKSFDLSDSFIGLTIIAIGTSLPELVTSAAAALKKKTDIAVGNVVGSNIFNLLWILGISAVIKPLPFDIISNVDILIIIISSSLLILAMAIGRKYIIERWNGILFVLLYIAYIIFLIHRG